MHTALWRHHPGGAPGHDVARRSAAWTRAAGGGRVGPPGVTRRLEEGARP